jgi:hypothetical protein
MINEKDSIIKKSKIKEIMKKKKITATYKNF